MGGRLSGGLALLALGQGGLGGFQSGGVWRHAQHTAVGVQDQGGAVLDLEQRAADGDHRRDAHGGRQDRHVRGRTTARGDEAGHGGGIHAHQLRGQQFVGQQDRTGRQDGPLVLLAGQGAQHLALEVHEVVDALGQAAVAQAAQGLDIATDGFAPGIAGALALADQAAGASGEFRVFQEGQVGAEDGLASLVALGGVLLDAGADGVEGGRKRGLLVSSALALLAHHDVCSGQAHRLADRQARRCQNALQHAVARQLCGTGRLRGDGGRRRGLRRDRAALAHAAVDQLSHGQDRRLGVHAGGHNLDGVAVADSQRHHPDRALGAGAAVDGHEGDLGHELAGRLGDAGGRASMDAVGQRHHDLARHLAIGHQAGGGRTAQGRQFHQEVADRQLAILVAADDLEGVQIGDHHRGDQAAGALGQQVDVEAQQLVAGLHALAFLDEDGKALAVQGHGLQTDVHQDFSPVGRAQGHGVAGAVHGGDHRVARRVQRRVQRIDGQAVAQHALGEHGVGGLVERRDPALQRRGEYEVGHGRYSSSEN